MNTWQQALARSPATGAAAGIAAVAAIALLGRRDSGSALAPVNAATHVVAGDAAGLVERATLRHTLPGLAINLGAGLWWALVFEKLFGEQVDQHGAAAAALGGAATAGLAFLVDYRLLPPRLSPGWELRLSKRSLLTSLGAMGAGLALGAVLQRRARLP